MISFTLFFVGRESGGLNQIMGSSESRLRCSSIKGELILVLLIPLSTGSPVYSLLLLVGIEISPSIPKTPKSAQPLRGFSLQFSHLPHVA